MRAPVCHPVRPVHTAELSRAYLSHEIARAFEFGGVTARCRDNVFVGEGQLLLAGSHVDAGGGEASVVKADLFRLEL